MATYTIRNLIHDAYRESMVLGVGMSLDATQVSDGLMLLNLILDEVYTIGMQPSPVAVPVVFDGRADYTLGPQPLDPLTEPVPDFELAAVPIAINLIKYEFGGVNMNAVNIDPITYYSDLTTVASDAPYSFYFEKSNPLATIHFYEGNPSGNGQLIFAPSLVDVTANTNYSVFPRELRSYLIYELAFRIAEQNAFDGTAIKVRSNRSWRLYRNSIVQDNNFIPDRSAPNVCSDRLTRNDFYSGNF